MTGQGSLTLLTEPLIKLTANDCHATQNINYDSHATQINFNDCHATLNIYTALGVLDLVTDAVSLS